MDDIRHIAKKYRDHSFVVTGRETTELGFRYVIEAPGKTEEEAKTFARDSLGPGHIRPIDKDKWSYLMILNQRIIFDDV
jgi:hypothetical protein